jgi:hypothetical protein
VAAAEAGGRFAAAAVDIDGARVGVSDVRLGGWGWGGIPTRRRGDTATRRAGEGANGLRDRGVGALTGGCLHAIQESCDDLFHLGFVEIPDSKHGAVCVLHL